MLTHQVLRHKVDVRRLANLSAVNNCHCSRCLAIDPAQCTCARKHLADATANVLGIFINEIEFISDELWLIA